MIELIEEISFNVSTQNTPVVIDDYAWYGYTVNNVTLRTPSGTCNVTFDISGTPITGLSAIDGTSVLASFTATAANVLSVASNLTMDINSATATFIYGSMKVTRT